MPSSVLRRSAPLLLCALLTTAGARLHAQTASPATRKPAPKTAAKPRAQNTPAPPDDSQLSPRAAYDEAMHPVILTRSAIANWSETEQAALGVAIQRATAACAARDAKTSHGAPLVDLARLCALGMGWPKVIEATTQFIDDPANGSSPVLPDAYAARVDADLHLKSGDDALRDARVMLAAMPYTAIVAEASSEAIGYLRFLATPDAITVARARQGHILQAIAALATPPASTTAPAAVQTGPAQAPAFSLHELYEQALALPSLEQFNADPAAAVIDYAALEAALPATMTADETLPIAMYRRRYELLGKPLAAIAGIHYLSPPNLLPQLPAPRTVTGLLLFPDWCAQCVAMATKLPETVFTVGGHSAYLYGLLALTTPQTAIPPSADAGGSQHFSAAYAAAMLNEHPVLTVPPVTLDHFAATEFPFLIVADSQGIVRALELMDAEDLKPGGLIDQAMLDVATRWAPPKPHEASVPTPATVPRQ